VNRFINWRGHGFLALPARWYLGWVFAVASIHKIADPAAFAMDVATYDILPLQLINVMAICLPWIELVAGIALITGVKSRAAAWLTTGMMIMFMVALVLALHKGLDMSCGCFASASMEEGDEISWKTVLRDSGWLLLSVYVLIFDKAPLGMRTAVSLLRHRKRKTP